MRLTVLPSTCMIGFNTMIWHFPAKRPERGGPCWQLKLRWMGTQRVQMKGVLPWLVRWACRAGPRDLVSSVQNVFCLTVHFFNPFVPIVQQAGQAAVLGHLSLRMCLCFLDCNVLFRWRLGWKGRQTGACRQVLTWDTRLKKAWCTPPPHPQPNRTGVGFLIICHQTRQGTQYS